MLDYLRIMLNARTAKMDERGASAVEYGLLIAGIAALIVVVVFAFGDNLTGIFTDTCNEVRQRSGGDCADRSILMTGRRGTDGRGAPPLFGFTTRVR